MDVRTGIQPTTEGAHDKEPRLRACVRDLLTLSAIPAKWIGRSPSEIGDGARDLLVKIVRPDSTYVEVYDNDLEEPHVAVGGTAGHQDLYFASFAIGRNTELGRLAAGSRRPGFPDEFERLLLQVAADQLAVALRQAHLLRFHEHSELRLKIQASQQAAVAAFGLRALGGTPSDQLLDDALSLVLQTLRVDLAEILQVLDEGSSLVLRAGTGWSPEAAVRTEAGAGTFADYTLRAGEPVIVDDLGQESRFRGSTRLLEHGVVSGVNVIIHGQRRPYGVLGAYTRERRALSSDEVHFLQGIANVLAASVQRDDHEAERDDLLVRMRRAAAARDRAVGIVSHDLGNPLSTIQVCAHALLDPDPPPVAGMRHMAEIIQRSVAWMQQIAEDLLDRNSLDAGRLVLEREPTAILDVIGAAQALFAPVAREHEVELVVEGNVDLPPINADRRRLLQILSNLLGNAIKFTPPGGRVELSARSAENEAAVARTAGAPGSAVRFQVTDTGPGIPPADLGHIFDWFWHSDDSERSGTGMGLAIAGGLVQAHGARLHVESAPGDGSTFWFTIPAIGEG